MARSRAMVIALVLAMMGPELGLGALAAATTVTSATPAAVSFQSYSTNWAGYAVTGSAQSVTEVTGSWTQPSVTCGSATTYAAFWDGIDGYSSSTVEQGGTLAYCSGGAAYYYAWYEFYPHPSHEFTSLMVSPGDQISVTVAYSTSSKEFTVTVQVGTSSASKSSKVSGAERNSAECITERPEVGSRLAKLADFGTADFGQGYTSTIGCGATIGGTTADFGNFSSSSVNPIDMEDNSGYVLCSTSSLTSGGSSFVETWDRSS
jgi:hypothetical protein